jgi:hypothetical protein
MDSTYLVLILALMMSYSRLVIVLPMMLKNLANAVKHETRYNIIIMIIIIYSLVQCKEVYIRITDYITHTEKQSSTRGKEMCSSPRPISSIT